MKGSDARRVLLVGFMGSGKSSVGRELGERLGWHFEDVDAVVVSQVGMSIAEIFERRGEHFFREEEDRCTRDLLGRDHVVIATGGGWAAVPGRLGAVPEGTASIWLEVSAEEAVRRAEILPGRRPLLGGSDPLARARELLVERSTEYGRAKWKVDTEELSVEDVSVRILKILERNDSPNEVA